MDIERIIYTKIEELLEDPKLQKGLDAIRLIEKIQFDIVAFHDDDTSKSLKSLKAGTTLIMAVFKKLSEGKLPTGYSKEDWKEVADYVSKYAIEADGEQYSMYVFMLYAAYIESSATLPQFRIPDEKRENILVLSDIIKQKTEDLHNGEIREVDYIDECLWISLEAMIKLLNAYIGTVIGENRSRLLEGFSMLAFEFGRYSLYQREDAILTAYIENQYALDENLQERYNAYLADLESTTEQFNKLMNKAFDPDFGSELRNSVDFAKSMGVREEELLKSLYDIDDYFM